MPKPSKREEVARLKAQGLTPRQIALALGLSTQGVHYHLKAIEAASSTKERSA